MRQHWPQYNNVIISQVYTFLIITQWILMTSEEYLWAGYKSYKLEKKSFSASMSVVFMLFAAKYVLKG